MESLRKRDGRSLDHKALEDIRIQAVQRVEAGEAPSAAMRVMGFARTVIYDWLNKYRAGGTRGAAGVADSGTATQADGPAARLGVSHGEPRPTRSGQLPPAGARVSPLLDARRWRRDSRRSRQLLPVVLPLAPATAQFPEPLLRSLAQHVLSSSSPVSSLDSPYSLTTQDLCHICAKSTIQKK